MEHYDDFGFPSENDHDNHDHVDHNIDPHLLKEDLTTESEEYHQETNIESGIDENKISRMLIVLGHGLRTTEKNNPDQDHHYPDLDYDHHYHMDSAADYEIEDRIVRYAMNKYHEEI